MIRPLRSRHRGMIVVLAVIAPLVLAAGLMVRRPMPRMERLPGAVGPGVVDPGQVIATYHRGSGLVFGLEARLIRRTESPSGLSLVVEALGDSDPYSRYELRSPSLPRLKGYVERPGRSACHIL